MIATLIRQDPAFRRLPFWVVMATVWASAAAGMIAWITARRGAVTPELLALLIWFSIALYLVFGEIRTRSSGFNLSLPISSRQLWLSHVIAVTVTGVVVLVVSAGMTTGTLFLIGKLVGGWWLDAETLVTLGGLLLAGLLLAIGILHLFRPDAQRVQMSIRSASWSLVAAAVPVVALVVMRPLGLIAVAIVLALAATTFVYLFRALPRTLTVPAETRRVSGPAEAGATGAAAWATTQRSTGLWSALRIVHGVTTCAKKAVGIWVVLLFLLFMGFWVSGIDARWSSSSQRFAYPFMIVYVMMTITTMTVAGLGVIDWLPWSRRRTLALITMPMFLTVAVGYAGGRVVDMALGNGDRELLCFAKDRETDESRFCVLSSACEISWSGAVPEVTAPWGEAHEPWNEPVVRGLPVRVYFPYSIPPGSSVEFAALQISRAADAVLGIDVPPDEIRSRYLQSTVDGSPPELSLQADYAGARPVGQGVYFPWLMAMVMIMWSLLTAGYAHWLRGGVSERRRKTMAVVFIALPMVLWICDFVLEVSGASAILVRNAFIINLARSAGATSVGTMGVWAGSALLAWWAYRLLERRFERAELNVNPICGLSSAE